MDFGAKFLVDRINRGELIAYDGLGVLSPLPRTERNSAPGHWQDVGWGGRVWAGDLPNRVVLPGQKARRGVKR